METVWKEVKASSGRSWLDLQCLVSKFGKERTPNEVIQNYHISCKTLPIEDRVLYGSYLKNESFFLEQCKTCLRLFKPCVLESHSGSCNKKNGIGLAKKNTFVPPSKKKSNKRSNKSTSEDDSESVISSENSSPALDLLENQVNDSCVQRDDSMIDVISVEEVPSEDSKPPTPGPQDLYEEFVTPFAEEASSSFSSSLESSDIKFKPALKLKIISSKDANQRSHGTSLLEAHLLSNTKYNTSSGISNVDIVKNPVFKRVTTTSLLEQAILKNDDVIDQSDTLKLIGSSKLKTDTKISIPISILPQSVKIGSSMKKLSIVSKNVLSKTNLQKLVNSKERTDCLQSSSPFNTISESSGSAKSSVEYGKAKTSARSKKNKRSKGKNRSSKNTDFDPDRHCGVALDENRRCMRSLTCKTHSMALRRSVEGRSKEFDRLLAEHRASKEALKDQDRLQNLNLSEPIISIPLLAVDKIAGNTIQIPTSNNSPEVVRVRLSNTSSGSENQRRQAESDLQKSKEELSNKKSNTAPRLSASSAALNLKAANITKYRLIPIGKLQSDTSTQKKDIKFSFVCSPMLVKVGGLLCTDRSRQAIRKCMLPLTSNGARQETTPSKQVPPRNKISDFLHSIKSSGSPLIKLSLRNDPSDASSAANVKIENQPRNSEEIERMKNFLETSSQVLNTLSTDENELRKLKLTRVKRSASRGRANNGKRTKLDSITDENYDINTLLSFDKSLLNKSSNDVSQYTVVPSDAYGCSFRSTPNSLVREEAKFSVQTQSSDTLPVNYNVVAGNSGIRVGLGSTNENIVNYQGNDTPLWQTFQDMESEIINTVGVGNIQELYSTQPLSNDNSYTGSYVNADSLASNAGYSENGENYIEETISKNYKLLEQYCKNITTDELLSDGKYYESNTSQIGESEMKMNKTGANIISEHMYTNVGNPTVEVGNTVSIPADELNFDTRVLNSYLTSENGTTVQNMNINSMNFVGGEQFNSVRLNPPIQGQALSQEHVYDEILTLNKQFPNSTAVNIDKPPTPNTVNKETDNEEVLMKWLF